jgi:hypothetical protein
VEAGRDPSVEAVAVEPISAVAAVMLAVVADTVSA